MIALRNCWFWGTLRLVPGTRTPYGSRGGGKCSDRFGAALLAAGLCGGCVGLGDADHAAADACSGVACGLAAVVFPGVDDDAPADDRVPMPNNTDVVYGVLVVGAATAVCAEVAQVAGVARPVFGAR